MYPGAASRVVWWVMENRRRYFEMARPLLPRVAAAVFIAHSQAATWRGWASAGASAPAPASALLKYGTSVGRTRDSRLGPEARPLPDCTPVVPLSLSPSLALLAGLSPLPPRNSSVHQVSKAMRIQGEHERVAVAAAEDALGLLRQRMRSAMGVGEGDTVVLCLSSVNPGKGQLGLVRATLAAWERMGAEASQLAKESAPGDTARDELVDEGARGRQQSGSTSALCPGQTSSEHSRKRIGGRLVLALGSMGCKSNKEQYVQLLHSTIVAAAALSPAVAQHLKDGALLWVNSTLSVGPLYSAADVYVMNSQVSGFLCLPVPLDTARSSREGGEECGQERELGCYSRSGLGDVPTLSASFLMLSLADPGTCGFSLAIFSHCLLTMPCVAGPGRDVR